ncbi:hypothetical protein LEP1GSC059_1952 [Leptospira noguchii serovar Panama str. CZ214]|uniref:Uncharacterized protein n=1 Tax=Leptospira noguchii serovar Panama str. CZ214 TaxID=1001595 RepID=T0FHM6_9LEPT|nr:hypothetical protein LEP1GSC059_1952 [Leptospira noguchii serovar Panama str. CZ214]
MKKNFLKVAVPTISELICKIVICASSHIFSVYGNIRSFVRVPTSIFSEGKIKF